MHRTALPFAEAGLLAEHLGHNPVRVEAARQCVTVIAVMGDDIVSSFERGYGTDTGSFLTDV